MPSKSLKRTIVIGIIAIFTTDVPLKQWATTEVFCPNKHPFLFVYRDIRVDIANDSTRPVRILYTE